MNYSIAQVNGLSVIGYFLKCHQCGKKIVVEAVLNGVNHNVSMSAVCAECVELNDEFKTAQSNIARSIEEFKAENI
jgi:hypothetical protein